MQGSILSKFQLLNAVDSDCENWYDRRPGSYLYTVKLLYNLAHEIKMG